MKKWLYILGITIVSMGFSSCTVHHHTHKHPKPPKHHHKGPKPPKPPKHHYHW
ncbi:MAG TPA: hypothetical protein H9984_05595 [Candidatus Parabacteroides faecavium]|nr:hypothetical protein [Candidatus Parabacteroides faecavium]